MTSALLSTAAAPAMREATQWDVWLLIFYFMLAMVVSFLCSLAEATVLAVPRSYAIQMKNEGRKSGAILDRMKQEIDGPLAAILTLNTIAHTVGAAGVGAQSAVIFGETWVIVTSVILTLAILVFTEIIPKTAGALYSRALAPFVAYLIRTMMYISYPIVVGLDLIARMFPKPKGPQVTREDLTVMAEMSLVGGTLHNRETRIIKNLLSLRDYAVKDEMTPRKVVFMLQKDLTAAEAMAKAEGTPFSRIPVYGEDNDDVVGVVLRRELSDAVRLNEGEKKIEALKRPIRAIPDIATLDNVLWQFFATGHHMFLVVDEYGGTAGIVTLEDAFEAMLGHEIMDETDQFADLQELAKARRERAERKSRRTTPES